MAEKLVCQCCKKSKKGITNRKYVGKDGEVSEKPVCDTCWKVKAGNDSGNAG